jgi:anti-anti-sigma regulatory factor
VITFDVDEPKSLLVIRYRGLVTAEETEKGLNDVRSGLAKLKSGFRVLVDLTELDKMDVGCAPFIEKAMDLCDEKGASTVVRVIPDPHRDIGLQIMSVFHDSGDVRIITCQSLAEANEILFSETQS